MVSYSGETDLNKTPNGISAMIMKNGDIYKVTFRVTSLKHNLN